MARHAAIARILPLAAAVAALGLPALIALGGLAVLVLTAACWVIASQDRTNRVSQLLLARRGDPRYLPQAKSESSDGESAERDSPP
jgi:hypothetical protein